VRIPSAILAVWRGAHGTAERASLFGGFDRFPDCTRVVLTRSEGAI
jgi:hypothetical protein